ncbi:GNAT family N-acetyltransferase [Shewanella pneumatophori]|uniref:GNAT family N-acetyltransferase n=1 Tax=Shewanella pneumatophori TaxID=314092 RepID=A0A9X1ZA38_9GAMM|nr:GNAT family N-acetyltransferase [Shewanella pneumatophori]MCL1137232.1 GNAT family N-acetyltransferase [Shewanella pneumatophori]
MTTLTTPRLIISPMSLDDTELQFQLDQDSMVMKYINGGRVPSLEEIETVFMPRFAAYRDVEKGWGLWKVFINQSQTLVNEADKVEAYFAGWILIRPMYFFTDTPRYDDLEIGWRFKQETWGKGIATESATKVIEHILQTQPEIKHLSAIADEQNLASINIMKKLGMSFKGNLDHPDAGDDVEVVLYSKTV